MKIASWNVNSLNVRLPQVLDWLRDHPVDVLALQETKLPDERFPAAAITQAGYHVAYAGQPTYNGVAILTRRPPDSVSKDLPWDGDPQRRFLALTIGDLRIVNVYVPNGEAVGSEKYAYKLGWLEKFHPYLAQELINHPRLVLLGDFNIAPDDRDVYDPAAWQDKILCSTPERDAYKKILALGMHDSFRLFEQPAGIFSWWDYRMAGFRRNLGLRIDLVLVSDALSKECLSSQVDKIPRAWERPSDHAPVLVDLTST
jgi:exodeoxyribonuclease-3